MTGQPRPPAGLLLRLAGPLQSWGERSHFSERDTAGFPTRSGVVGLLALALGRTRGEPIDDLTRLGMTVRVDRAGVFLHDFHTVGGGEPNPKATVTTADGGKRGAKTATLVSHRYYLADAAFTLALTASGEEGHDLLQRCAEALGSPCWPPYLGRRACPPDQPLLIGLSDRPLEHLVAVPLARPRPPADTRSVEVEFHGDQPLTALPAHDGFPDPDRANDGADPVGETNDQPVTFHPGRRWYRPRPRYTRTLALPAELCGGVGRDYAERLGEFLGSTSRGADPEGASP
ncbi:type I-E CRISPR-associated protein Cas5/CasD [Actinoalloteichus caeruleus]|uniref:type I-E CRISPR-associated protein Cas5/CasD n=1 Tax=Actinoalloteichus cyanogriseus TaxID=2893586 RepID=UPI003AACAA26